MSSPSAIGNSVIFLQRSRMTIFARFAVALVVVHRASLFDSSRFTQGVGFTT